MRDFALSILVFVVLVFGGTSARSQDLAAMLEDRLADIVSRSAGYPMSGHETGGGPRLVANSDTPHVQALFDGGECPQGAETKFYEIAAIRTRIPLKDARSIDGWTIGFSVLEKHQQNMADLTQRAGSYLAVILDGKVHATPRLTESIRSHCQITGGFSEQEATALATLLQSESLPVRLALLGR